MNNTKDGGKLTDFLRVRTQKMPSGKRYCVTTILDNQRVVLAEKLSKKIVAKRYTLTPYECDITCQEILLHVAIFMRDEKNVSRIIINWNDERSLVSHTENVYCNDSGTEVIISAL